MSDEQILKRLRNVLLGLSLFIFIGTLVELSALEHTHEPLQYIPFGLCILGILLTAYMLIKPGRDALSSLRVGMWIIFLGGIFGMIVHVSGNVEMLLRYNQGESFIQLYKMGMGGRDPFLAPAVVSIAGLLALAGVYQHPAGRK